MDVTSIPGITFAIKSASVKDKTLTVTMVGTTDDPSITERVLEKLELHRVYAVDDIAAQAMDALQREHTAKCSEYERELTALRDQNERLRQRLSAYEHPKTEPAFQPRTVYCNMCGHPAPADTAKFEFGITVGVCCQNGD